MRYAIRFIFAFALPLLLMLVWGQFVTAQDTSLNLTLAAEHNIGFDCPEASAVQPNSGVMWVLMSNCGGNRFSLMKFDLESGQPLSESAIPLDEIDGKLYYLDSFVNPMGFTGENTLEITFSDSETYLPVRFEVDVDTGVMSSNAEADEQLGALLSELSMYPETTVYSGDHSLAVTAGDPVFHVIDLESGEVITEIEGSSAEMSAFARFSPDNKKIYIALYDEPENMENYDSTLYVYSLPDGELLQSAALPNSIFYPSPDGRYAAVRTAEELLLVVNLEAGNSSQGLEIHEAPSPVLTCINDGRDMSDVDFQRSGKLWMNGLEWLPDAAGFVTVNSYNGQGAGGGAPCFFDYSRLRQYSIEISGN